MQVFFEKRNIFQGIIAYVKGFENLMNVLPTVVRHSIRSLMELQEDVLIILDKMLYIYHYFFIVYIFWFFCRFFLIIMWF
ncbi:hypothetical protein COMX_01845 [Commensalibacter papalotli (ex Servin-Garciduenas et al. 2014)]|uniref:Uncharacterized protein n=1 Tax=Commensalibacter papalotli (ex Servin-Garciduenas et al. 2014) TaxID=1208583 RepID=W7E5U1_9PROT|nr:hypothetical protein COMX_01845 [Commensalibacter papalotli (ex Servin-Garciduenas et al. 2014)]